MRHCLIALLVSLFAGVAGAADQLPLIVHVIDCAGVKPVAMTIAEHSMRDTFGRAGIRALWREDRSSTAPTGVNHVTVVILPRDMAEKKAAADGVSANALAIAALPPARRAWIFLDRVVEEAARQGAQLGSVLGVVIAHEVAHVAAGIAHSADGIMERDLRMAQPGAIGFNTAQRDQIRTVLRTPVAAVTGQTRLEVASDVRPLLSEDAVEHRVARAAVPTRLVPPDHAVFLRAQCLDRPL